MIMRVIVGLVIFLKIPIFPRLLFSSILPQSKTANDDKFWCSAMSQPRPPLWRAAGGADLARSAPHTLL